MNNYYTRKGRFLGTARSLMKCNDSDDKYDHEPHVWNSPHVFYGPYFCPGFPEKAIYDTQPRMPVNMRRKT